MFIKKTLADFEELISHCNSESSRLYIEEAISCYNAGAYRSSIVSTWIAVVFDLIDKVRELTISGDGKAKEIYNKYDSYITEINRGNESGIKNALDFERNILNYCKDDLGFFDYQQFTDLCRLRDDRNRCAHPSFQEVGLPFSPSAELARLHIRNAIFHVLSTAPVQGKSAVANIVSQIGSQYFPTDKKEITASLEKAGLDRPNESLIKNLTDKLMFGFFDNSLDIYHKDQIITAINILSDKYPDIMEAKIKRNLNKLFQLAVDEEVIWLTSMTLMIIIGWSVADDFSRNKIIAFIKVESSKDFISKLYQVYTHDDLKAVVEYRIDNLNSNDLMSLVGHENIQDLVKKRSLILLSQSRSFDQANAVISKLLLPMIESMSSADIEKILKMPTECGSDLIGAHLVRQLILSAREKEIVNGQDLDEMLTSNGFGYLLPQQQTS